MLWPRVKSKDISEGCPFFLSQIKLLKTDLIYCLSLTEKSHRFEPGLGAYAHRVAQPDQSSVYVVQGNQGFMANEEVGYEGMEKQGCACAAV